MLLVLARARRESLLLPRSLSARSLLSFFGSRGREREPDFDFLQFDPPS